LLRGTLELVDNQLTEAEASFKAYVALATRSESLAPAPEMSRGLVQAYLQLAEIAEKNNHLEQANAYLQRIASPQDLVRVQSRRAMILARQGKMPEARELIRNLPEAQPSDASAKLMAEVQLLKEFKQFPAAYQLLTQALDGNRKDVELTYELATVAEKIGKFDEMETLLRQVLLLKPDYHAAYNALGYSLADRKIRLAEARQLITKALEFAPEDPYIIDSLAWVEFRSGNSAEALRLLQKAFKARPDAEIAAHMGEVLWVQGEAAQAKTIWNQGKSLNPANETLLETIQRLSPPP
jgi:tetratricopeptide (TPR) repeat protein